MSQEFFPNTSPGTRGLVYREPLIFERSVPGRSGASLPSAGVPETDPADEIPAELLRGPIEHFPSNSENEVVRHYVRLSQTNHSIDTGFYPLGSCTMKYNPKVNEWAARLPGFANAHPYLPPEQLQGVLELMWNLQNLLSEIGGFAATSLQPAAGAHGELAGLMIIRAYHLDRHGTPRKKVLIPDSAHGTNPASAALLGYQAVELPSNEKGMLEPEVVARAMDEDVAALMVTNPNTLGIFETHIKEIAEIVHAKGGLVYGDGANMNAILGVARPGDLGIDVMHYNLHKTFSTPHGGGGPGAGPVSVAAALEPYLPRPVVVKEGDAFRLDFDRPKSIGKLRTFWGNFGMMVRAYTYILELGREGLRRTAELAVLNAQYLRKLLEADWHVAYENPSLHEVIFTDRNLKETGVTTMDVAKALIDHGFHPPTVYFPLVVSGALMIEPTETESKETLEAFAAAMKAIYERAKTDPEGLKRAPEKPVVERLDEARAARKPVLRWTPDFEIPF
ncbi:MAG: aminomethyl-transferring glycine dehydrogenase subunit GcvPB [Pseudomonadota bacterium]|nr:MAG: aminomethyl-transferring glycine dehydrogenase subunit GcvPB [Pseudomonadota bacterium]